jgi:hypothetical protein
MPNRRQVAIAVVLLVLLAAVVVTIVLVVRKRHKSNNTPSQPQCNVLSVNSNGYTVSECQAAGTPTETIAGPGQYSSWPNITNIDQAITLCNQTPGCMTVTIDGHGNAFMFNMRPNPASGLWLEPSTKATGQTAVRNFN